MSAVDTPDLLDAIDELVAEASALNHAFRHPSIEDHIAAARAALHNERKR